MKLAKKTGDILHFFYRYNLIKEKDIRMEIILFYFLTIWISGRILFLHR